MEPSFTTLTALCIDPGDRYEYDGRIYTVRSTSHTPGSWWVYVRRSDGTTHKHYIGEMLDIQV